MVYHLDKFLTIIYYFYAIDVWAIIFLFVHLNREKRYYSLETTFLDIVMLDQVQEFWLASVFFFTFSVNTSSERTQTGEFGVDNFPISKYLIVLNY